MSSACQRHRHDVMNVDLDAAGPGKVDIIDTEGLVRAFEVFHPAVVFQIAAIADVRAALSDPVRAVQVNIGGTGKCVRGRAANEDRSRRRCETCWVAKRWPTAFWTRRHRSCRPVGTHRSSTKIASELIAHDSIACTVRSSQCCDTASRMGQGRGQD